MEEPDQTQDPADDNTELEETPLGVPAGADPGEDDSQPGFPEHDPTEG